MRVLLVSLLLLLAGCTPSVCELGATWGCPDVGQHEDWRK